MVLATLAIYSLTFSPWKQLPPHAICELSDYRYRVTSVKVTNSGGLHVDIVIVTCISTLLLYFILLSMMPRE